MAETQLQNDGAIFRPSVRRAIYLVCILSAGAYLASMLWGRKLSGIEATPEDSYGNGPIGHRALAEFAEALGYTVLQNRSPNYGGPEAAMLFVSPGSEARVDGHLHRFEEALRARRDLGRPSLVVLPKWHITPGPAGAPPSTGAASPVPPERLSTVLRGVLGEAEAQGPEGQSSREQAPTKELLTLAEGESFELSGILGEFRIHTADLQLIARPPADSLVLLEGEAGALILEQNGVVLVSDPGFLLNYNLHRGDHGALIAALLERTGADTIVIDETFHGHGRSYSLGAALGEFPAILIVVQGIVLLMLLMASGMHRFGPPLKERPQDGGPGALIAVTGRVLADGTPFVNLAHFYLVALFDDLLHRNNANPEGLPVLEKARLADRFANRLGIASQAEGLLHQAGAVSKESEAFELVQEAHSFYRRLVPLNDQERTP